MRKRITVSAVAVAVLSVAAIGGTVLATSGSAGASKPPAAATCSSIAGTTTVAIEVGGSAASIVNGCSGGKATAYGVDVSTLSNPSPTAGAGTGTIYWTNNKTTTYSYAVSAPTSSFTCQATELDHAWTGQETITVSGLGGNAKVLAPGSFNVCYYLGNDGTLYEASVGTVTF
jgi:hypothetical protein